jgi:hypothetical protein
MKGVADFELGRDSGSGKILCMAVKYWCMVRQTGGEGVSNGR